MRPTGRKRAASCRRQPDNGSHQRCSPADHPRGTRRVAISQRNALEEDQLLTASQAAKLLHVSERWLYKYASKLPYAVRLSETVVRFSRNKIQAEIRRKL